MMIDSDRIELHEEELPLVERVVKISRVAKVVKGGRHLSFNAVVVVGDGEGRVGIGMGKADAVPDAVKKGTTAAKKNTIYIHLKGTPSHTKLPLSTAGLSSCLSPPLPERG